MEIGNNDEEIIDDEFNDVVEESPDKSNSSESNTEDNSAREEIELDFITLLLQDRGIEDKNKIKFEDEDGEIKEESWDKLSDSDKINIIRSSEITPETGLDDSEIQLINSIRNSGMNPAEYLEYIGNANIQNYLQNEQQPQFEVDQYSDDELFVMDLLTKTEDVTDDEALEALTKAKSNESLYQKLMLSIRNEYRQAEQENRMQEQLELEQANQQQYEEFSNQIVDEINNLTNIQGFDLNMENDDMLELYDFIVGQDAAGNNYFAKSLADPRILVKTAWLTLNGDQMIDDITSYFQKEITKVRKESYKKGVEDTQNKMNGYNNMVFKNKSNPNQEVYGDLDDF